MAQGWRDYTGKEKKRLDRVFRLLYRIGALVFFDEFPSEEVDREDDQHVEDVEHGDWDSSILSNFVSFEHIDTWQWDKERNIRYTEHCSVGPTIFIDEQVNKY